MSLVRSGHFMRVEMEESNDKPCEYNLCLFIYVCANHFFLLSYLFSVLWLCAPQQSLMLSRSILRCRRLRHSHFLFFLLLLLCVTYPQIEKYQMLSAAALSYIHNNIFVFFLHFILFFFILHFHSFFFVFFLLCCR